MYLQTKMKLKLQDVCYSLRAKTIFLEVTRGEALFKTKTLNNRDVKSLAIPEWHAILRNLSKQSFTFSS